MLERIKTIRSILSELALIACLAEDQESELLKVRAKRLKIIIINRIVFFSWFKDKEIIKKKAIHSLHTYYDDFLDLRTGYYQSMH